MRSEDWSQDWKHRIRRSDLISVSLIGAVLAAICAPIAASGWVLTDDHQIIENSHAKPLHPQLEGRLGPLDYFIDVSQPRGRFEPLDYTLRYAVTRLVGARFFALHAAMFFVGWVTLLCLFTASRIAGLFPSKALLIPLLTLLAPDAFSIWYRLGTAETWGTLFLSLALVCCFAAVRSGRLFWDLAMLTTSVAAALSKESFALVLPALAILRWWLVRTAPTWWSSQTKAQIVEPGTLRRGRRVVSGLLISFGLISVVVLVTVLRASSGSEGGMALRASGSGALKFAFYGVAAVAFLGGGWLPVLAVILSKGRQGLVEWVRKDNLAVPVIFLLAWLVPQYAVYVSRGGPLGRFALPSAIGIAMAMTGAIVYVSSRGPRIARTVCAAWLIGWATVAGLHIVKTVSAARADGAALKQMLVELSRDLPQNRPIAILTEPSDQEGAMALIALLGYYGRPDVPIYYIRAHATHQNVPLGGEWLVHIEEALHQGLITNWFAKHQIGDLEDPNQLSAIILRVPSSELPPQLAGTIHSGSWIERQWCEPMLTGSVLSGRILTRERICYRALVLAQNSEGLGWGSDE